MPAYAENIIDAEVPTHKANLTKEILNDGYQRKETVVVSGMSGRFPDSANVNEFATNLFNGVDMVSSDDRRWVPGLHGLPPRSGKLFDLSHFDASFFSVSPRQAHCMDPQLRILLEVTYEAIFDAGLHPNALKGKRVGVYVGVSGSETEECITSDPEKITGYELTGCCRAMFANRISYVLDLKGPSFAVDTACSSALVALYTAWNAMASGEIEAAIVAGSNLTLKPQSSMQFNALGMLSTDGRCKAFDSRANGYVRSEAVTAILLQRQRDAARIYAQVVQAVANTDGNKSEGITFPSGQVQAALLREVYQKAAVNPADVSYIEAHGTGTKAGDPQELGAITEVFCSGDRLQPLLIGSVKSNMGHSEPASGLCAMIKILLSYQNHEIPANLHFESPNSDIPALNDGRIKVVSQNTPWRGKFAAVNCFGFGGANVHVLLKAPEEVTPAISTNSMLKPINSSANLLMSGASPRLMLVSGRTEEHVEKVLTEFQANRHSHFASLVDNINAYESSAVSYPFRGYTIVGGISEDERQILNVSECPVDRSSLWLVFSGMGSQWRGCGRALLEIPVFDDVIQRCRSKLLPHGIDLVDIITREEPDPFSSITASFTAIASMQVGLMEILKSIGVTEYDGLVGHSVGELGCAYADGALNAEQTVLAAYWRGRSVEEAGLPVGAMAAVGLSDVEAENWIPKDSSVIVACKNSSSSVTISGPKEEVGSIQSKLEAEGVFCRAVDSGGIAFHHSNLKKAAPKLLEELQKVIICPIERSSRWVSTSVPEAKWNTGIAQKASAEYWVNNLISPVLFANAISKIPEGATVIEVSPHALMQAVLRRALNNCNLVPLIRKENKDTLSHLLQAFGKLYCHGSYISLRSLNSTVKFPVDVQTPSIGHLVSWNHSVEWDVAKFTGSAGTSEFKVEIDLNDPSTSFVEGHVIDGRVLFPATGYMTLAWRAIGKMMQKNWEEIAVTFKDVILHQATVLSPSNPSVVFTVRLLPSKGDFEVLAGETVAASGQIHVGVKESSERSSLQERVKATSTRDEGKSSHHHLSHREIYKELGLRGYQYGGIFRGIKSSNLQGTKGEVLWKENWISLLDTLLQFSLLGSPMKGLYLPTRIRKVHIVPDQFLRSLTQEEEKSTKVFHSSHLSATVCPGIEIYGLKATMAPRRAPTDAPALESYTFHPTNITTSHKALEHLVFDDSVKLMMDLVLENTTALKIKIGHIGGPVRDSVSTDSLLASTLLKVFEFHPLLYPEYIYKFAASEVMESHEEERSELESKGITIVEKIETEQLAKHSLLVFSQKQLESDDMSLLSSLPKSSFILVHGSDLLRANLIQVGFTEVASIEKDNLYLFRQRNLERDVEIIEIDSSDESFSWVDSLKTNLNSTNKTDPLWLVSRGCNFNGLLGMAKCLKREPGGERIRVIVDPEMSLEKFSESWNLVLARDLVYNVILGGELGTMRHLPLRNIEKVKSNYSYLNVLTRGDLSSLTWILASVPSEVTNTDRIFCNVNYAPLNFRDIMLASGKLPPDALPGSLAQKECILGLEFSGISTHDKKRVMGLVPAGGLASYVYCDPYLTWEVPSNWSLKEASTVPVVYSTAYYALVVRGCLRQGESVLIHAGSGGVGQAAISIALARGCTVYTTVSSEKKRQFLKKRFPKLTDNNFANSRDSTFEYHVLEQTNGRGVDVVLNSLAGDLLQASVRCLKEHGRFLEIGKADLANNTALGMSIFLKNVTFHGILLDALFEGSIENKQVLQKVLTEGISKGEVKPLPLTMYSYQDSEEAFRFMASGKHIGKVVLEVCAEIANDNKIRKEKSSAEKVAVSWNRQSIPVDFRFWPKPNLSYVITGGLGGLGLELTEWLLSRGAIHVILTSRKGISTGYQAMCLKRWNNSGSDVRVLKKDASTLEGANDLLKSASAVAPVGGIFHLAVVLEDSLLENQTPEKFRKVSTIKANGAICLDQSSRKLCPELHAWVTFSSVACGKGNAGQSNYGWANSISERVAEMRLADGLPGVAIQWGGIADVGVLADTLGNVEVAGTKPQSLRSVLGSLDYLLGAGIPVVCSVCLSSKKLLGKDSKGGKSLVSSLANILGIRDVNKAPMNVSLGDLGMDSLMAVEIKQTLEREADVVYSAEQIRELTIGQVVQLQNEGSLESPPKGNTSDADSMVGRKDERNGAFSWLNFPLVPKDALKVIHDLKDYSGAPLFIASPIQGTCDVLSQVAMQIGTRVIGLEYPPQLSSTHIGTIATKLIQEVEKVTSGDNFHLAGYSYGAGIAYEMATQFERKGRSPLSLTLLDGSHSYVSGIINTYMTKYNSAFMSIGSSIAEQDQLITAQGQSDALMTYTLQYCSTDAQKLRNSLFNLSSFEERINFVAKTIIEHVNKPNFTGGGNQLTLDEVKCSASLFYDRLVASFQRSTPVENIAIPTLLVRAIHNNLQGNFGNDYGLSKVVKSSLVVKDIPGTHESFILGRNAEQVAKCINDFLGLN